MLNVEAISHLFKESNKKQGMNQSEFLHIMRRI